MSLNLIWMKLSKLKKTYNLPTHMKNLTVFFVQQGKSVQLLRFKFQDLKNQNLMVIKESIFSYLTDQDLWVERGLNKPIKLLFCFWCLCLKIHISISSVSDQSLTDFTTKVKNILIGQLKKLFKWLKDSQLIMEERKLLNLYLILQRKRLFWEKDTKDMLLSWRMVKSPILKVSYKSLKIWMRN